MEHIGIDLGGRESQVCVRTNDEKIVEERRMLTIKLGAYLSKKEAARVILETCSESFGIADQAIAAGHDVRVVPATLVKSPWSGSARHQNGPARCAGVERSIVPDRAAIGAHPKRPVPRTQNPVRDARRTGGVANKTDQLGAWMVTRESATTPRRQYVHVCRTSSRALRCQERRCASARRAVARKRRAPERADPRCRPRCGGARKGRRDLSAVDDRARRGSRHGDTVSRSHRRRHPLPRRAQARVVPRDRAGRAVELRQKASHVYHQGGVHEAAVDADTGRLVCTSLPRRNDGPNGPMVFRGRKKAWKADRHCRIGAQDRRHPVCVVARRLLVQPEQAAARRALADSQVQHWRSAPRSFLINDCPEAMIATLNVKHGLRVTDCDSPTDAKYCASSTNSRLRQLVAEVLEGRRPPIQGRTVFDRRIRLRLTRRPLHSRSSPRRSWRS